MGQRHFQPQATSTATAPRTRPGADIDSGARLLHSLQQFFEVSRDQFEDVDLRIPEWHQADDALERAYDACVAREAIPIIKSLCSNAHRYIDMAVEVSTARSYYDGRI
ncbi:MAG: hypothetical protein LH481_02615 [Burkholderiales bacterium]|nr:hypothetical protein [Burkholderiales bacterium]